MRRTLLLASEFPSSLPKMRPFLEDRKGQRALFIPTAAYGENFEPAYEHYVQPLEEAGLHVTTFDIAGKTQNAVAEALKGIAVLSVSGGNSFFLLEHMQNCGFRTLLNSFFSSEGLYIGSSAGSIVCSPDIAYITPMDDPTKASITSTKGLDLIGFSFLPHLDHPHLGASAKTIRETHCGPTPLLALYDSQFAHIDGQVVTLY